MPGRVPSDRTIRIADLLRSGGTDADIAREFGVTQQGVNHIRHRLDIPVKVKEKPQKTPDPRRWTEGELAYVFDHQYDSLNDIASALGRTSDGVRSKWLNLVRRELVAPRRRLLTEFDDQLINDLTMSTSDVAAKTGRSMGIIRGIRQQRGIRAVRTTPGSKEGAIGQFAYYWTPEEIAYLAVNHHRTAKEVAVALGRSTKAVKNKRQALWGADRPKE